MKFISNYYSNQEWIVTPEIIVVDMPEHWNQKLESVHSALESIGGNSMVFWWAIHDYEFYDKQGKIVNYQADLDGCSVRAYKNHMFQLYLPFKHTPEEGWSEDINWNDGVVEINPEVIQQWVLHTY